jgi:hypothetical protein
VGWGVLIDVIDGNVVGRGGVLKIIGAPQMAGLTIAVVLIARNKPTRNTENAINKARQRVLLFMYDCPVQLTI